MKKTINIMKEDLAEAGRNSYKALSEIANDGVMGVVCTPRNLLRFGKDISMGYLDEQTFSTIGAPRKSKSCEGFAGYLTGLLAGSAQDALMVMGAISWYGGSDEMYTKVAAIVTGAKIASNLTAKTIKWGMSARKRSLETTHLSKK